ncbi:sn-glycerol 3-phosphate transport system ATP-binding protein [Gracilibacillus ureilyticus]|uniref:sn-glycerol 3-phosphate transport system ATP-binding protein n=1 Tax=Gracilibacillus ureilyticus TaxID=531814 RepID=A0A1H9ML04_9BACI|nr:ABC transporter ATP-binding protein [Gracilibacillus ureilyticus]SER24376.1 sn-glycerol 3-phosphate transport system ATP-binding protein [Gracilibacillus ureilyticus]
MKKEIQFEHVKKSYGDTEVVKDLNFTIKEGERLILLGPSGCGKSTILRMIAGLENITDGNLYMNGEKMNHVPSGLRNVSMVFQNYALYPHMTVKQNIVYGLKVQKLPKQEMENRLNSVMEILQLRGLEDRLPKSLSGGQRQRVALARATVKRSDFFLLDEPLSNLDAQLRESARKELVKIHEMFNQTIVYVTHDQIEAMTFADRIALMYNGELQMLDTPDNVYHRPANVFTAKFIGSPSANILEADYRNGWVHTGNQAFEVNDSWKEHMNKQSFDDILFGIRPEHLELSTSPMSNGLEGRIKYIENLGKSCSIYLEADGQEMIAVSENGSWKQGQSVYVRPQSDRIHFFNKATEKSLGHPAERTETNQTIEERRVLV